MAEKTYKPTQAMINAAKRGLALREKYNRGGLSTQEAGKQGIGSGVARARDIIDGNLSLESVKRMHSFFSRHAKNYNPGKKESDGGPTAGTIASLLWGGPSGAAWARSILRKEDLLKSVESEMILKSLNDELMQATYVCMIPGEDAHGDYVDVDTIREACHNFNRSPKRANLFHKAMTDSVEFVESYILPIDIEMQDSSGNTRSIPQGSWLVVTQTHNEEIWKAQKDGTINGVSIGAKGRRITIDEDE